MTAKTGKVSAAYIVENEALQYLSIQEMLPASYKKDFGVISVHKQYSTASWLLARPCGHGYDSWLD